MKRYTTQRDSEVSERKNSFNPMSTLAKLTPRFKTGIQSQAVEAFRSRNKSVTVTQTS